MQDFPEYEPFRHGLVTSKIWLCEELEKIISNQNYFNSTLHILAAWHNLLTFMLLVRNPKNYYRQIFSYDINPDFTSAANRLCDTWKFEEPKVQNITTDINVYQNYTLTERNIFINCSVDQIDKLDWYENIPKNNLVCLQTTNLSNPNYPWYIKTVTTHIDDVIKLFPMRDIIYTGTKTINYGNWGYNRYMIIGIK